MRCHTNAVCQAAGGGQSAAVPVAAQEGAGSHPEREKADLHWREAAGTAGREKEWAE